MSIKINLIGNPESTEYKAADQLKDIFQDELKNCKDGEITIATGIQCFGSEVQDVDIVILGQFANGLKWNIKCRSKKYFQEGYILKNGEEVDTKGKTIIEPLLNRDVYIHNFCLVVELKDLSKGLIRFNQSRAIGKYFEGEKDITDQSQSQKYSLQRFFRDSIQWSPSVCNLIWFRNLTKDDFPKVPHNWLPQIPSLTWIFQLICNQHYPFKSGNYYKFKCDFSNSNVSENFNRALEFFKDFKDNVGTVTRTKLEKITKKVILQDQDYVKEIGNKLLIIKGKAGTGKTIKLLHLAHDLCKYENQSCLILTYNKALVSDIRRLIALAGIDSDLDKPRIVIRTIYSYLRTILKALGLYDSIKNVELNKLKKQLDVKFGQNIIDKKTYDYKIEAFEEKFFLDYYEELKKELLSYLNDKIISKGDIHKAMEMNHEEIIWQKILIDEGQDWPTDERDILFYLFNYQDFIVADGVDQLIRGTERGVWNAHVPHHIESKGQRRSLRQKANLCKFIQSYSDKANINWDVLINEKFLNGNIIIKCKGYDQAIHKELYQKCQQDGNNAYEMLFLAPPNLVECNDSKKKIFKYSKLWNSWGLKLWDGTNKDVRSDFPVDPEQFRVLQYDSSRGLEGWVVVCLNIDDFFEYKCNSYIDKESQMELGSRSLNEKKKQFAFQWSLIPFTRAIDSLVITIKNPKSEFSLLLKEVATECKDFVSWID